jgi:hypothetical protein
MSHLIRFADLRRQHRHTYFDRRELNKLLSLYAQRVMRGEWRDYAIDHRPGMAVFSVFRHSHDLPLYSIVKHQMAGERTASYLVLSGRHRLKIGTTLDEVLAVLKVNLCLVS